MNKKQLANELKKRQIKAGYISIDKIEKLTDKQIISSYLICSECGEWLLPYEEAILSGIYTITFIIKEIVFKSEEER